MVVTTVEGYYWDLVLEVREAVKYPTRHRTSHNKESNVPSAKESNVPSANEKPCFRTMLFCGEK